MRSRGTNMGFTAGICDFHLMLASRIAFTLIVGARIDAMVA